MNSTEALYQYDEEFRDTIATVDAHGKRIWVYPKKPGGHYHRLRIAVTIILLSVFFLGPFIRIGGQPFMLFNVFERKFILFGQPFWPQDFVLLAVTAITFFVFIILFTVAFGRVWCGWACPQTLFLEMVFRKIEYAIEGDAGAQRKLKEAPWTGGKILKKGTKHFIFIVISLLISHTVMAYLIGLDQTLEIIQDNPLNQTAGFIGLMAFTGIFYGVFAKFREQACIAVCPYGRLQGVLLVKESIVVAYDWLRGEPRGKIKKNELTTGLGDCIDCKLCVHVCPTGIDIRNGTQLECVNCTACMDACDEVMVKINKPKGLIRYASYNSIKDGIQKLVNPRLIGYTVVMLGLLSLLGFLIFTRTEVETTVLKVRGTLYQKTDDGYITNLYNIEFVNKTFGDIKVELKIESPASALLSRVGNQSEIIPAEEILKGVYFIKIKPEDLTSARTDIKIGVYRGDKLIETVSTKFLGPIPVKK